MKSIKILLLLASTAFSACDDGEGKPSGIEIRQYADFVIGQSSEYTISGNWSAERALGAPNVFPAHGDNVNAWASATADNQREHLILGFDTVQTVRAVEIYETYYPGAVDTVYLRNASTLKWTIVYSRPFEVLPTVSRKLVFFFKETDFRVDAIRIALNSPEVPSWNEIDAVAIHGYRTKGEGE
jgi:hypothetical protein